MQNLKHVGRVRTTDSKVVVVFPQVPNEDDQCLVIYPTSLPNWLHDAVMATIESDKAQNMAVLAYALDGAYDQHAKESLLGVLHRGGFLRKMPVESVVLYPNNRTAIPLADWIKSPEYQNPMKRVEEIQKKKLESERLSEEQRNHHAHNMKVQEDETKRNMARSLLQHADMLEQDVRRKREEAFRLVPSLRAQYEAREADRDIGRMVTESPSVSSGTEMAPDAHASSGDYDHLRGPTNADPVGGHSPSGNLTENPQPASHDALAALAASAAGETGQPFGGQQ